MFSNSDQQKISQIMKHALILIVSMVENYSENSRLFLRPAYKMINEEKVVTVGLLY